MANLSAVAQTILDAYQFAPIEDELTAAAVLRAAADQFFFDWNGMCCSEHLKSIADELEGRKSRPFSELTKDFTPERRDKIEQHKEEIRQDIVECPEMFDLVWPSWVEPDEEN